MTKYTIIEDGSPYYITFKFDGIDEIIQSLDEINNYIVKERPDCYVNPWWSNIPSPFKEEFMRKLPFPAELDLNENRLALWTSFPGMPPLAHKDGEKTRWGINFSVSIKDDKVITVWYDEKEMIDTYALNEDKCEKGLGQREIINFDSNRNHTILKTVTLKQGEAMLINTDLFHSPDPRNATFKRVILSMRTRKHGDVYFDDVKKMLFPSLSDYTLP